MTKTLGIAVLLLQFVPVAWGIFTARPKHRLNDFAGALLCVGCALLLMAILVDGFGF